MEKIYIVVELQKNNGQMANIVTTYSTESEAWNKFYTIAAAAAISEIDKHAAILLDDDCFTIDKIVFEH